MKTLSLISLAMLTLATSGDEVVLRQRAGDEITRHFTFTSAMSLQEAQVLVDGEEMSGADGVEQEITEEVEIILRDVIQEVEGDHATKFARTYEKLSGHTSYRTNDPMGAEQEQDSPMESELEEHTVVFAGADDEFVASFPPGEAADEKLLEGLVGRVDLAGFLPEGPVDEGDEWNVDPAVIAGLSTPGGDLHLRALDGAGGGDDRPSDEETAPEGEVVAKYLGMREEDGLRLAAIAITVDISLTLDLTDSMVVMEESPDDLPEGTVIPGIELMTKETLRSGKGLVLWNVEKGRLHSLELECDVTEVQSIVMALAIQGMEQEISQVMEMGGTENYTVRFDG